MAKTPGRKPSSENSAAPSAEHSASRRSPRMSPRKSVDSSKQAASEELIHPCGKRPPKPLEQFAVGQVIEVPWLREWVGRHEGFWDDEGEQDNLKIGTAIIAAICNDCMLVLPILYLQRTKGSLALDVVDPNKTPEPGSSDPMADTIAGEVLGVRSAPGEWKLEPDAYVRLNYVVTVDFDEKNWATFEIEVVGDLHDESKALLERRTSFVLGKMIYLCPSAQNGAYIEHTQVQSRDTHSVDWHKGYAAAKKKYEAEDDDDDDDDEELMTMAGPRNQRVKGRLARALRS